ncbi:GumC family protein [Pseudoroseicyclus tamaricis]|uniref:Polysaccharide chain length determinant protein (PEP-CTERM system associated) n=1 Tax=Pseudoroseicyclus tamaricis TaxID=2705421 RepID=A0A6B2JQU8_9RHOB|nr:hypothetical protein [Pseudoroseicyclus tamaricis]NDV00528.1 hypothetical protein [Pseudoroseicyclus tamaricis]
MTQARRTFVPPLLRLPLVQLSFGRVLKGGRPNDLGRLPRYAGLFAIALVCVWAPITGYLKTAPLRYTSGMSLILPGAGSSASVNLDQIGQASSNSSSPFSSSSVSPTETYKRLFGADRIVAAAAGEMDMRRVDFGQPRVELIDQTGLIHVSITGNSPDDAQARGEALLQAFFSEIEELRTDELHQRQQSGLGAIDDYRSSVLATRDEISRLQRETGLISAEQYGALVAEAETLAARVSDLGATLDDRTEAVAALQASLGTDARLAASALKLHADTEFAALTEEMSAQAALLSQARARFGESHPDVRAARSGYAAAEAEAMSRAARLTGLGEAELATLDISHVGSRAGLLSDLVAAEAERAGLAAEHAVLTERLAAVEARKLDLIEPAARLEDMQRDFRVAEAVFASAMARAETTKTDVYASYPLVQVLEDPSLPVEPSSPKRKLAVAAGVAGSLFAMMGLLLGWIRRPLITRLIPDDPVQPGAAPAYAVPAE